MEPANGTPQPIEETMISTATYDFTAMAENAIEDPIVFFSAHSGDLTDVVDGILAAHVLTEEQALRMLAFLRNNYSAPGWIRCGPIAAPASPTGIRAIRELKRYAHDVIRFRLSSAVDPDSLVGRFARNVETAAVDDEVVKNWGYGAKGARLAIDVVLSRNVMESLPVGPAPKPIKSESLEGQEFDGDRIEEWRSDADACIDGTTEFLNRIGVNYETDSSECDCGCCGEPEEITWCEDFTITDRIVRMLDKAGYLDATLDFFDLGAGSWEDVAELNDAELDDRIRMLPRKFVRWEVRGGTELDAPTPEAVMEEQTAHYDPTVWEFIPDYVGLGMDSVDYDDVARILPRIVAMVDDCAKRGLLPPIDGILRQRNAYGRHDWTWSAEYGYLEHNAKDVTVRFTPEDGTSAILTAGRAVPVRDGKVIFAPCDGSAILDQWFALSTREIA